MSQRLVEAICRLRSGLTAGHADDVRITRVCDRKHTDSVVSPARGAQIVVVACEVVHTGLCKHRVVLDLALPQRWTVVRDQDELRLTLPQRLH